MEGGTTSGIEAEGERWREVRLLKLKFIFGAVTLAGVSKVEQMEKELRKLSQAELHQVRAWLDDLLEDELEFTPEFETAIQASERDMAEGKPTRVREPERQ